MNLMFWRRRDKDATPSGDELLLERLSAYLDGEVTDEEAAEVESLIARDEAAADLLNDLAVMQSALGALGEVRAPRSFAVPADLATASSPAAAGASAFGGGAVAIFRRSELFMRASAAVAALFFVVALVNNPTGSTPTASLQTETTEAFQAQAENAAAGTALESGPGEAAGAMLAPAPSSEGETPAGAAGETTGDAADEGGTDDGDGPSTLAVPNPEGGNAEDGAAGGGTAEGGVGGGVTTDAVTKTPDMTPPSVPGDTSRAAGELRPLPAGTELVEDASQGVGGMVPALGILAGLLTALSALTAWTRRSGSSTR